MNINLEAFYADLPMVNRKSNYWMIRTSSGEYYEDFVKFGFVGIGWNNITLEDIFEIKSSPKNKELFNQIKKKISVKQDLSEAGENSSQTKILRQIIRFVYEIKKGDIVVIPSKDSGLLAFGEVVESPVYIGSGVELEHCKHQKRKKILWIKTHVNRYKLEFDLYKFLMAHQTVTNVTVYRDAINSNIYDFYVDSDNIASIVLRVRSHEKIDPFIMSELYSDMTWFLSEAAEYEGTDLNVHPMFTKMSLQSPGVLVFGGLMGLGLLLLGAATILSKGNVNIDLNFLGIKLKGKYETEGLLFALSKFLNGKQERKERAKRMLENMKHFEVAQNEEILRITGITSEQIKDSADDSQIKEKN